MLDLSFLFAIARWWRHYRHRLVDGFAVAYWWLYVPYRFPRAPVLRQRAALVPTTSSGADALILIGIWRSCQHLFSPGVLVGGWTPLPLVTGALAVMPSPLTFNDIPATLTRIARRSVFWPFSWTLLVPDALFRCARGSSNFWLP